MEPREVAESLLKDDAACLRQLISLWQQAEAKDDIVVLTQAHLLMQRIGTALQAGAYRCV